MLTFWHIFQVAGEESAFNQVEPILKASYSTVMFTGELGTAMIPKVVSNMLCCIQVIALGEVMMVGKSQPGLATNTILFCLFSVKNIFKANQHTCERSKDTIGNN